METRRAEPTETAPLTVDAPGPVTRRGHLVEVGGAAVTRLIPTRQLRTVGPFCFLDRFGLGDLAGSTPLSVGPHPHLGIQTLTWLGRGSVIHRDSLGSEALVGPRQVSLMTAGAGLSHAEVAAPGPVADPLGAQLWVALAGPAREQAPGYELVRDPPARRLGEAFVTVALGSLAGLASPAATYSPAVCAEIELGSSTELELELDERFEHAVVLLSGVARLEGVAIGAEASLSLAPGRASVRLAGAAHSRVLLIGGAPFEEELLMWWNFVARTREEIAAARSDWVEGRRFGTVEGAGLDPVPAPPLPSARLLARSGGAAASRSRGA